MEAILTHNEKNTCDFAIFTSSLWVFYSRGSLNERVGVVENASVEDWVTVLVCI